MTGQLSRILVAGIGNVFLGDDGFGIEAARQLALRDLPDGVIVADYGIRGLDLAYALLEPFDAVIFLDAAVKGGEPGTLYLIEPAIPAAGAVTLDVHNMDPVKVLAMAQAMGAPRTRIYIVACEPEFLPAPDGDDVHLELSRPVAAAAGEAIKMVEDLIDQILESRSHAKGGEILCG